MVVSMQKYGLIGYPVKHSLSPAMQNAAFRSYGIEARYDLYEVDPDRLEPFLRNAGRDGLTGFNVTIPHKINVKDYIEAHGILDDDAKRLGAVNTVKVEGKKLRGSNTDGPGFNRSLVNDLGFDVTDKTVIVFGAGGASRAVVMNLGNRPKKIYITDVDSKKALELATHYRAYYDEKRLHCVFSHDISSVIKEAELLINATPIGMKDGDPMPLDKDLLHDKLAVYDLVYNRPETALVHEALKRKLKAVTGLGMLLYQGAIAFEIWTGKEAPVDIMREALNNALKNK